MVTAGLYYALIEGDSTDSHFILTLIFLDILLIILMAFWFSAVARQCNFDEMESIREAHAREREKLRVNAERQKNRLADKKNKEMLRETKRAYALANIKVGSAFASMLILGGIMIYSQFITFGLLMLTSAGGGLIGYLARAKQETLFQGRGPLIQKLSPASSRKKQSKKLT